MVYGIIPGHYLPKQIDRHVSDIPGWGLKKGDVPKGRMINKPRIAVADSSLLGLIQLLSGLHVT